MLAYLQLIALLLCGIVLALGVIIATSKSFRDANGELPMGPNAVSLVLIVGALAGGVSVALIAVQVKEDLDRAETQQMIDDLRRAAKGY